jgi:hypothetical protein
LGSLRALLTFGLIHHHKDLSWLVANHSLDDRHRRMAVIESHVIDELHHSIRIIDAARLFLVMHAED